MGQRFATFRTTFWGLKLQGVHAVKMKLSTATKSEMLKECLLAVNINCMFRQAAEELEAAGNAYVGLGEFC